jgi:hypothetical protein
MSLKKELTKHLLKHAEWIWYEASLNAQKQANKNVRYQNFAFTSDTDYLTCMSRNFTHGRQSLISACC